MKAKLPISAAILTRNSAGTLSACLRSLPDVSEILIIDDNSSDGTISIAMDFGARVLLRPLDNFSSQRNFAIREAGFPWVLFLDSDEILDETLRKSIQEISFNNKNTLPDGFMTNRRNEIFGKIIAHGGWGNDYKMRLFPGEKNRFEGYVHEEVTIDGKITTLEGSIIHRNYKNVAHFLKKIPLYTELEKEQKLIAGEYGFSRIITRPLGEAYFRLVKMRGYRDGWRGYVLAVLMAYYVLLTYWKTLVSK